MNDSKKNELVQEIADIIAKRPPHRNNSNDKENKERSFCGSGFIMRVLYRRGKASPGELCEVMNVTKPRVTAILNELEEAGQIVRAADENDRRNVIVTLTPQGHSTVEGMIKRRHDRIGELVDSVGEDDAAAFIRVLKKVKEDFPDIRL